MNKQELISSIADNAKVTKSDAAAMVDAFVDSITSALKTGDEVRLTGFGTFKITERKATTGRNPRTGEEIKIAARKSAKFSAGKSLSDSVNTSGKTASKK